MAEITADQPPTYDAYPLTCYLLQPISKHDVKHDISHYTTPHYKFYIACIQHDIKTATELLTPEIANNTLNTWLFGKILTSNSPIELADFLFKNLKLNLCVKHIPKLVYDECYILDRGLLADVLFTYVWMNCDIKLVEWYLTNIPVQQLDQLLTRPGFNNWKNYEWLLNKLAPNVEFIEPIYKRVCRCSINTNLIKQTIWLEYKRILTEYVKKIENTDVIKQ